MPPGGAAGPPPNGDAERRRNARRDGVSNALTRLAISRAVRFFVDVRLYREIKGQTMRALLYTGPNKMELADLPTPQPAEGEVLVAVHAVRHLWL